jgi:hypothetical protein
MNVKKGYNVGWDGGRDSRHDGFIVEWEMAVSFYLLIIFLPGSKYHYHQKHNNNQSMSSKAQHLTTAATAPNLYYKYICFKLSNTIFLM